MCVCVCVRVCVCKKMLREIKCCPKAAQSVISGKRPFYADICK